MAITKFDLYNREWLELVFDGKNKDYGAYDLRKHYAANLIKAMGISFFSVAFLYFGYNILKPRQETVTARPYVETVVHMVNDVKPPVVVPPRPQVSHPAVHAATVKYPVLVATRDKDAENPPKIADLQTAAIGTQTKSGDKVDDNISIDDIGTGTAPAMPVVTEEKPKETYEIQVMPEPYGGEAAWAKFLQKNIHYPAAAIDAHAQGKVFLSFIVEKDGHISNIIVERGVGYGIDQEAVRVMKLAPAWKPGIQNGHQVRVKFNMPISFQLTDND
jgi:protein TonB